MRERVPEVRHAEFVFELGGVVFFKLIRDPANERSSFNFAGLFFLFGGHLLEVELLLHFIEKIESGVEFEFGQIVETEITLFSAILVTGIAIVLQEVGGFFRDFKIIEALLFCLSPQIRSHRDHSNSEKEERSLTKSSHFLSAADGG